MKRALKANRCLFYDIKKSEPHPCGKYCFYAIIILVQLFIFFSAPISEVLIRINFAPDILTFARKFFLLLMFAVSSLYVIYKNTVAFRFSRVQFFLAFMMIMALVVGLLRDKLGYFYLVHVYYFALGFVYFSFFYEGQPFGFGHLRKIIKLSSYIFPVIFFFCIMFLHYHVSCYGLPVSLQISSSPLLLSLIFFLHEKKYLWAFFSFSLLVASLKRGPIFVVLPLLFIYLLIRSGVSFKAVLFLLSLFVAIFLLLLPFVLNSQVMDIVSINFPSISARFQYMNPFDENFCLHLLTAGRFSEIKGAISEFMNLRLWWIFGAGAGFTYTWDGGESTGAVYTGIQSHYLHVSILNYLIYVGPILFFLFAVSLLSSIGRIHTYVLRMRNNSITVLYMYFIAELMLSFNAFTFAASPYLWLIFGYLFSQTCLTQKKKSRNL